MNWYLVNTNKDQPAMWRKFKTYPGLEVQINHFRSLFCFGQVHSWKETVSDI